MSVLSKEDMAVKGAMSIAVRSERAAIKRALRTGDIRAHQVFLDPPACLATTVLFDVLRTLPGFGPVKLRVLNRRAVADGINLAVSLGNASLRTRTWIVSRLGSTDFVA